MEKQRKRFEVLVGELTQCRRTGVPVGAAVWTALNALRRAGFSAPPSIELVAAVGVAYQLTAGSLADMGQLAKVRAGSSMFLVGPEEWIASLAGAQGIFE